jgi:hypothetical protein
MVIHYPLSIVGGGSHDCNTTKKSPTWRSLLNEEGYNFSVEPKDTKRGHR